MAAKKNPLATRISKMKRGQSFTVKTDAERKFALGVARFQNIKIVTRKCDGGFTVLRLP